MSSVVPLFPERKEIARTPRMMAEDMLLAIHTATVQFVVIQKQHPEAVRLAEFAYREKGKLGTAAVIAMIEKHLSGIKLAVMNNQPKES